MMRAIVEVEESAEQNMGDSVLDGMSKEFAEVWMSRKSPHLELWEEAYKRRNR